MQIAHRVRQSLLALVLVLALVVTTACGSATTQAPSQVSQGDRVGLTPDHTIGYNQLSRGDSASGQSFGEWVVAASQGLIQDAFVRDDNKLGVVISTQVRPDEVKPLSKSLAQGFRKNFPNRDLTVLVYAPDKKLILTARYDSQSQQLDYQAAS